MKAADERCILLHHLLPRHIFTAPSRPHRRADLSLRRFYLGAQAFNFALHGDLLTSSAMSLNLFENGKQAAAATAGTS
jgi:hypothetical protein